MKIEIIRNLLEKGQLEPYIRHIRFPQYKNVLPFTKIDFTFPITAIVGANGTNKSSLLKALYGAPGSNNLGNYWFSTETDPILEGDDFPNCFIYGYLNNHTNKIVEVLKTRVKKENDPDYWEPSRPIKRYEMAAMPEHDPNDNNRSKTRWKAINKKVELIDFRHALSAFDRYFYHGNFKNEETFSEKKQFLRTKSPHLKSAIDQSLKSYHYYNVERIFNRENRKLSPDELNTVKYILGRDYEQINLIGHSFFRNEGYTARIIDKSHHYTEAFAGSGEFAVIMLVTQIINSQPNSLILLDEPEVSLHPGAQERLLEFLANQVIQNKHQVIFTTHSPALIRGLPPDAIKVLSLDRSTFRVVLTSQQSMPEEAFLQIGESISGLKSIIAEDRLAIEIIKRALRIHHPAYLKLLKFHFFPGGASALFQNYVTPYSAESRKEVLCVFDGDQKPDVEWPNHKEVSKIENNDLTELIKKLTGSDIRFPINSGTQTEKFEQKSKAQRDFLNWSANYVRYLPGKLNPEQFVLSKIKHSEYLDGKCTFVKLTRESLGLSDLEEDPNADSIFQEQCRRVAEIPSNDTDLEKLAKIVEEFMKIA